MFFFKNDSENYEIITDSKNEENKEVNNKDNNKEDKENESSEEELNLTEVEDNKDILNNNNDEKKENEDEKNTKINNNLNEVIEENNLENKENNLENKDNNNNIDKKNDLNENEANNLDSNKEEIQRQRNSSSINDSDDINNNNNINNTYNKDDDINKEQENENNKEIIDNKIDNNNEKLNNNNSSLKNFSEKDNSSQRKNSNSKHHDDQWSYSEENKENSFSSEKDDNINNNENSQRKDNEEINNNNNNNNENNLNENNNIIINPTEKIDIQENNIINNEDNELKNINKEEEKNENKESLKNDNNINNNNNFINKDSIQFPKNDISSIKNNSSNNEQNSEEDLASSFFSKKISENSKNNINNKKADKTELKEEKNEIIYIKDEYYIKYIQLKRKGFRDIVEKNYVEGYNIFSECYELSSKHLMDKIKEIDSLINMSICQYYNGNFMDSLSLLYNSKKIFDTVSLGECHISPRDKIRLGIKLYTYSSMAHLSMNNYDESINDIKTLITLIEKENIFDKKVSLLKEALYILFKVDTLLNIKEEKEIIASINSKYYYNLSDKNLINLSDEKNSEINDMNSNNINEILMNDFLACLKYKNFMIILNSFIENAFLYKNNKNLTGYYFCIFNQYLITYNNEINVSKQEQEDNNINKEDKFKEIKERLFICYKNLLGEETALNIKEKKLNKNIKKFLSEFNGKMECSYEIFSLLENYEKTINQGLYQEKKGKKNIKKLKDDKESPYIAKLCLKYSLSYIRKKKESLIKDKTEESKESIQNIDLLIKEIEILLNKISTYEIDVSLMKMKYINQDIIKNINIFFKKIFHIYYKSLLYKGFHNFQKRTLKTKLTKDSENADKFLSDNYDIIIKGMTLTKINYGSKGHKNYFYSIDSDSDTLNIRVTGSEPYPKKSFNLYKDIRKLTYGPRSQNLIKILKNTNEGDADTRKYLKTPWKFFSFILKNKSLDLYCENEQVDNWFYGFKGFTNEKGVEYKIMSTNKFVLNKIKYRTAIKLKIAVDKGDIKEKKSIALINKIIKEKAFHNISFSKIMILYNKLIKV